MSIKYVQAKEIHFTGVAFINNLKLTDWYKIEGTKVWKINQIGLLKIIVGPGLITWSLIEQFDNEYYSVVELKSELEILQAKARFGLHGTIVEQK